MEQLTIERLLKVSSRLNQSSASTSSSSADTGRLSLKQLISVHESLLDSVSSAKTSASRDIGNVEISSIIPNYILSLDESKRQNVVSEIVGSVVNDEKELKICQDLLLSENHQDCDSILMVVQYLLRLSKAWNGNGNNTSSSPISDIEKLLLDITSITYPLIVSSKFDVQLRDAILDASFLQISSSSPDVNEEVDMGQSGNNQLNNYKRLHDTLTHCLILINQCVSSALSISMQDATKSVSNTLEWILVVVFYHAYLKCLKNMISMNISAVLIVMICQRFHLNNEKNVNNVYLNVCISYHYQYFIHYATMTMFLYLLMEGQLC